MYSSLRVNRTDSFARYQARAKLDWVLGHARQLCSAIFLLGCKVSVTMRNALEPASQQPVSSSSCKSVLAGPKAGSGWGCC